MLIDMFIHLFRAFFVDYDFFFNSFIDHYTYYEQDK